MCVLCGPYMIYRDLALLVRRDLINYTRVLVGTDGVTHFMLAALALIVYSPQVKAAVTTPRVRRTRGGMCSHVVDHIPRAA